MIKKQDATFAELFKELEHITKKFEDQNDLDLDASVKEFERGLEIAGQLKAKLSDIELKVKRIQEKFTSKSA